MRKPRPEYGAAAINADGESEGSDFYPTRQQAEQAARQIVSDGLAPAAIVECRTYLASVDPGSVFDDRVLMTIGCPLVLQAGGWEASP
jgi:hypothetical protein